MEIKLEVNDLCRKYGRKEVLSDLSFRLEPGIYGLLGPNGAGKSTLIRLITGYERATSGTIMYNGRLIEEMGADYRKEIGYMPQYQCLYDDYTLFEFLDYICAVKQIGRNERKTEIESVVSSVGLSDSMDQKLGTFSGGMRQRVMLAQTLLGNPHVLILDEPSAGLDPKERNRLRNLIAKIARDRIIVIATHIVSDIELIANYVMILNHGKLITMGTVQEVCNQLLGSVFEKKGMHDVALPSDSFMVTGVFRELDGLYRVRYILKGEEKQRSVDAVVSPNLDDVYLYYFGEEG